MTTRVELPVTAPADVSGSWPGAFDVFPWYYYVFNIPGPVFMVTTLKANGLPNVQLNRWGLLLGSGREGKFVLEVMRTSDTCRLIAESREFVINFPPLSLRDRFMRTTAHYADDVDEVTASGLTPVPSREVAPPRIAECWGHLECRLDWMRDVEDDVKVHILIQGSVVHSAIDASCLTDDFATSLERRAIPFRFTEHYCHSQKRCSEQGGFVLLDSKHVF